MSYRTNSPLSAHQVDILLGELCVRMGFCLPPEDIARLQHAPPQDAREFADEVFRAEGLDPATANLSLWRQVRDMIHAHFDRAQDERQSDQRH